MRAPTFNFLRPDGQKGPRDYTAPTVVRVYDSTAFIGYAVFGTPYGYVHTALGAMKLYSRRATAVAVALEYMEGAR